jgi:hypothetical protein
MNEYDGCTTQCAITPKYATVIVELPLNVSKFSDTRSISISLDNGTIPNIEGWDIFIDDYQDYVMNTSQLNNSLEIQFKLNSTLTNKYAAIRIP